MAELNISAPVKLKIKNTSAHTIGFVPYRESFVAYLAAGSTLEFEAKNSGAAMYYLKQVTRGLEVSTISAFDSASETVVVLTGNEKITLTNIGNSVVSFVPYKEGFTQEIAVGDKVVINAKYMSQVLYYLAQAIDGKLTVAHEAIVESTGK